VIFISHKLREVQAIAEGIEAHLARQGVRPLSIEGLPRAQIETRVKSALKWLADKPQHKSLLAQLELVELNLPNLK